MPKNTLFFLDCETKDNSLHLTSFSVHMDELIYDYAEWLRHNRITADDTELPMVYRASDLACVATLDLEDGEVFLQPRRAYNGPFAKQINGFWFDRRHVPASCK